MFPGAGYACGFCRLPFFLAMSTDIELDALGYATYVFDQAAEYRPLRVDHFPAKGLDLSFPVCVWYVPNPEHTFKA